MFSTKLQLEPSSLKMESSILEEMEILGLLGIDTALYFLIWLESFTQHERANVFYRTDIQSSIIPIIIIL